MIALDQQHAEVETFRRNPLLAGATTPMLGNSLSASVDGATSAAFADDRSLSVAVFGNPSFTGPFAGAPSASSAASVLLKGYVDAGRLLLEHVHGAFVVVLIDLQKDDVLLAVDRLGIATLCFGLKNGVIHFSTDAGEVANAMREGTALDGVGVGTIDPQAIYDYLFSHCIPAPRTVYREVTRLLPGHCLRWNSGVLTCEAYWAPSYETRTSDPLAVLESRFLDTVESSVARSIDGSRSPGCFLSGGTDSSTVAGMLGRVTGKPAETYSIGFDADGFDEMSYARIASKRFGTHHHEYYITPADLVASIPAIAATYDQPFGNSSVLPTYYCAKMAAADGIDRMLGGDGGDELFGGNTRYAKQRVFDYFDRAPTFVQATLRTALAPKLWDSVPVVRKARSYVQQADVPMPDRMQTYNLLTRIGLDTIFEPSFIAQVDTARPMKEMRAWYARSDATTLLNRMLAFDLKYTLTDNDLPKVVTACELAGVEVAFPFLDDALVAFAEKLDPELKLKGFKLRWFFKHALRDFLPPEILTKTKHGFGLPFGIWLGRDKALHELAFASLESLKGRGIVRIAFIDQLRADLLADHATYYGELVWVLMMLEQWLQTHAAAIPSSP